MDLKTVLRGHPELFYKESLSPVEEASKMGDRPGRFHFEEAARFLQKSGYGTTHFFYNHYNPLAPFCYFRDYIIVDFPFFTADTLKKYAVLDSIKLAEKRLGTALRKQDFRTFFAIIDPRLALLVFVERFDSIPKELRYTIFWHLYSRCEWRLDTFPVIFIEEIQKNLTHPLSLPGDEDGFLEVFHGTSHDGHSLECAFSWTLDINEAIHCADHPDKKGRVFKARIPVSQVLAYLPWKKQKEIIVFPGSVKEFEEVCFYPLSHFMEEIQKKGLWPVYEGYLNRLDPKYFYKPLGIHGLLHTKNVIFMVILLAHLQGLNQNDIDLLAQTALFHDIGRSNDNYDPHHGKDSFNKLEKLNLLKLAGNDRDIARFIIENHCIDDQDAKQKLDQYISHDRERALRLYSIFKDADGLDRVRIMDLDVKQLRSPEAVSLLLVAHQLLDPAALEKGSTSPFPKNI